MSCREACVSAVDVVRDDGDECKNQKANGGRSPFDRFGALFAHIWRVPGAKIRRRICTAEHLLEPGDSVG